MKRTKKRLVYAADVKDLMNGLDELPWEENVDYLVDGLPTVDAVEVVHAHWVPFYEEVPIYNGGGFTERRQTGWICSKCGKGFTQFGHQRYCGDCGARMDGGSHEQG